MWQLGFNLTIPVFWLASGILFFPTAIPDPYDRWLALNPLLQCVEWIRHAYYEDFQREWASDPARHVRIGEYSPSTGQWRFFYYPIDPVESPTADWVGLSEVVALSDDRLLILERDNAGGPDARNKRLYEVSIAGVTPQPQGGATPFPVLTKTLVRDLLPALRATGGWTQEKVEGVAVTKDKKLYVVTDNDGVDENTGETILLRLGRLE